MATMTALTAFTAFTTLTTLAATTNAGFLISHKTTLLLAHPWDKKSACGLDSSHGGPT